ncbi:MAG: GIY-YIG nuclease family protein [Patescibacteria group bacterium]
MPSNTTSSMFFYYVYVLESSKDRERYIGFTSNLKKRLEEHKKGLSFATKFRLPLKLIYYEACLNLQDAKRREQYLKNTQGRRFLGLRIKEYKRNQKAFGSGS